MFEGKGESKSTLPLLTITSPTGMEVTQAQVQDDLTFKSDGLTPGSYRVRVEGASNTYVKRIRTGEQEGPNDPFDLPAGELTVFLSPDADVVEGSVQNAKDETAPNVPVTLIPDFSHCTRLHKIAITEMRESAINLRENSRVNTALGRDVRRLLPQPENSNPSVA